MNDVTSVERVSDRELIVARVVNAPVRKVFQAWTQPELFRQWWVPKSAPIRLLSCEMDVRIGGGYRLVFEHEGSEVAFFGTYVEVVLESRLVWTNDEAGEAGQVTTVEFQDLDGRTRVVLRERYPTKDALDTAMGSGSLEGTVAQFEQLDEFVSST